MQALLDRLAPAQPKAELVSAFPTFSRPENVGMRDGCCCCCCFCCGAWGTGLLPLQVLLLVPPPVLVEANRPAPTPELDFGNTTEKSGSC